MKIITGIASTTHLDAHNERFTKNALDGMAEQINSRYIPLLTNHDPNQQIGVIMYGQVAPTTDGEFALLVVAAMFEGSDESYSFVNGAPNTAWSTYQHLIPGLSENVRTVGDGNGIQEDAFRERGNLADLVETHLDSTSVWVDGHVIKTKRLIASTGDLFIHVYRDHDPPHFHVLSKQRGIDVRFSLDTIEPLKGSIISPNDVKKIKEFFRLRPDILKRLNSEHARMQE